MSQGTPATNMRESRRAQMFPVLTAAQIARVRAAGSEQSFADGAIVFDAGDRGVPFFVVLEGTLEIVSPHDDREDVVTVHHAGEFTGEVTLLSNGRALVRARAKGPLRVLRVTSEGVRSLVQTDPDLSEVLVRAFILRRMGLLDAKAATPSSSARATPHRRSISRRSSSGTTIRIATSTSASIPTSTSCSRSCTLPSARSRSSSAVRDTSCVTRATRRSPIASA